MKQKSGFRRRSLSKKRGISEVLGAMLLMLVVVIVVGSFAYFVSTLQSQSQSRSSFITNIQDEKLQISNMQLAPDNPYIQYAIYNSTVNYDILMVNSNAVELINSTTALPLSLPNSSQPIQFALSNGHYNSINFSTVAAIFTNHTIAFGTGNCVFSTATWDYANMTIRNLNIQNSAVSRIEVNGIWLPSFAQIDGAGHFISNINSSTIPLQVPAKESVYVALNLSSYLIPKNDSLKIVILSTAGNYFTTFFGSPTALLTQSVNPENSLITQRDVPVFDGSTSSANQSSYIEAYIWRIDIPNNTAGAWDGSWGDTSQLATVFAYGQSFQYRPEAFFSGAELVNQNLTITGPFRVTLTVVDSYGLVTTSQSVVFSNDPNIAPAGMLSATNSTTGGCASGVAAVNVTVTVNDIFGRPLANAPVTVTPATNGLVVSPPIGVTNAAGQMQACVQLGSDTSGVLEIESGTLPTLYFTVS